MPSTSIFQRKVAFGSSAAMAEIAEASVIAMTKRSAVVRCELYRQDDERRMLAAAQATLTIVDPR